jgi:hypothetical protein
MKVPRFGSPRLFEREARDQATVKTAPSRPDRSVSAVPAEPEERGAAFAVIDNPVFRDTGALVEPPLQDIIAIDTVRHHNFDHQIGRAIDVPLGMPPSVIADEESDVGHSHVPIVHPERPPQTELGGNPRCNGRAEEPS